MFYELLYFPSPLVVGFMIYLEGLSVNIILTRYNGNRMYICSQSLVMMERNKCNVRNIISYVLCVPLARKHYKTQNFVRMTYYYYY